jgi:hypothetical protein
MSMPNDHRRMAGRRGTAALAFDWQPGGIPSSLSAIGHDDSVETCSMLYSE